MKQDDMTIKTDNTAMRQTTPDHPDFHSAVARAVSIEQLRNWDVEHDEELTSDYLKGFDLGKFYAVNALTNYLKTTFPVLASEPISIVLESETSHPELEINLPHWFCWDDGDGVLYGKGDEGDDGLYLPGMPEDA